MSPSQQDAVSSSSRAQSAAAEMFEFRFGDTCAVRLQIVSAHIHKQSTGLRRFGISALIDPSSVDAAAEAAREPRGGI